MLLTIDPGNKKSGWAIMSGKELRSFGKHENEELLNIMSNEEYDEVVIEMIESRGMPVGKETFETCVWIGRFVQKAAETSVPYNLIYRRQVKLHLCGSMRAKDSNIRQAILDLYPATGGGKIGQIGVKRNPGPLYGVSGDVWSAIAIGLTFQNIF